MRVPLEWLREYVDPHMDAHTLAERLALSGTEVERVEHHGVGSSENFAGGRGEDNSGNRDLLFHSIPHNSVFSPYECLCQMST